MAGCSNPPSRATQSPVGSCYGESGRRVGAPRRGGPRGVQWRARRPVITSASPVVPHTHTHRRTHTHTDHRPQTTDHRHTHTHHRRTHAHTDHTHTHTHTHTPQTTDTRAKSLARL
eukprot:2253631-Rhodomonas_salina.1